MKDPLYQHVSAHLLTQAGFLAKPFIDHSNEIPYTSNLTPVDKLKGGSGTVLVACGAFDPIHDGHIKAMEIARHQLEQMGQTVIGGYISPSHDEYVIGRKKGRPFFERLYQCQLKLDTHDWLMTDPWEGMQAQQINFSSLLWHIQETLSPKRPNTRICFVVGSDNIGFTHAFTEKTNMQIVCVPRPGHKLEGGAHNDNVIYAKEICTDIASSRLPKPKLGYSSTTDKAFYILRDDFLETVPSSSHKHHKIFKAEITQALQQVLPKNIQPLWVRVPSNLTPLSPCISLDKHVRANYNLDITRIFALGQLQAQPITLSSRVGHKPLENQIKEIPPGNYTLADDDIASGTTMRFIVKRLAANHIHITEQLALIEQAANIPRSAIFDILDASDLCLASTNGLTCVDHSGKMLRIHYIHPWVNLVTRASIPPEHLATFNQRLLDINQHLFQTKFQIHEPDYRPS